MTRSQLLSLFFILFVCLFLSAQLFAQDIPIPEAFNVVLQDIGEREGHAVIREQLLDYTYEYVLNDFFNACGSGALLHMRYYVITAITDRWNDYTYHVTDDGSRLELCSLERVPPTATPTVDLTRMTATPPVTPTVTGTPRPGAVQCEGFMSSRLMAGEQGRVLPDQTPNRLRDQPSAGGTLLGVIPPDQTFDVLAGPVCDSAGHAWWRVRYISTVGWTIEGEGQTYYVAPVIVLPALFPTNTQPPRAVTSTATPTATTTIPSATLTACVDVAPSRLVAGRRGQVTPGDPNNIRQQPSTSALVVGLIPGGEAFFVLNGPSCDADGRVWWQVNYQGMVGWTVESYRGEYYVEPLG